MKIYITRLLLNMIQRCLERFPEIIQTAEEDVRKKKEEQKGYPSLVVGREYRVVDEKRRTRTLVYFGRYENRYEFMNLSTGAGVSIRPAHDDAKNLFELGNVEWIEDGRQSKIKCPKIEEER